jgi:PTH1 family peptidyl-tRNA hydrolase
VKIIVGLGNPGSRYRRTRHNIGFQVIDRLAEMKGISVSRKRFKSLLGTGRVHTHEIILMKPLTFMNRSGEAVKEAANFFRTTVEDLVVVHDDLDLSFGKVRFKQKGGDGGHQGVRSIIESLGKGSFLRLKVGIGRPPEGVDPAEYVLSPFERFEHEQLDVILSRAAESISVAIEESLEVAMRRFQRRANPLSQVP